MTIAYLSTHCDQRWNISITWLYNTGSSTVIEKNICRVHFFPIFDCLSVLTLTTLIQEPSIKAKYANLSCFFLCFIRIPNLSLHLEIWTSLSVSIWITRTDTWRSIGISDIVWWLSHQWEEWWGTYPTNAGRTLWSISILHDFKMNDIRYEGIE